MTHFETAVTVNPALDITPVDDWSVAGRHSLLVVRDHVDQDNDFLEAICEFLDIGVAYATGSDDIGALLTAARPMAVIAPLEGEHQDGFHVMKVVAAHDRMLPVMLRAGNDTTLLGAVDAVQEIWGLRDVTTSGEAAGIGPLAEFIFSTARAAGTSGLMRV